MKKVLTLFATLVLFGARAQDFQGVAVYQSKTTFDITIGNSNDPAMDAALKEQLSKSMDNTYTLVFNKTESIFTQEEKLESPSLSTGGMNFNVGDGRHYKNLKDKTFIKETDMMGKEFLVTDSLDKYDWKLENETKKIGDYTCYKATHTIKPKPLTEEEKEQMKGIMGSLTEPKDIVVTAWYTPQIPVSHGPKDYWGLPGLILEASNGSTTLLCSKITLNPKEKVAIKVPKTGEKVTRAQLEEIMMAKLNEMNDMYAPAKNGAGTTTKVTTIRIGG